ncbi:MAG TPA: peptidylprolyl isomerase, partial [Candidatus Sulfotelmatobacter sp.]|nr:peptidylprolyl isomerase [Candidatus Sulfotelmatobacter sp.]
MLTWFRKKMKVIIVTVAFLFIASLFYGIGYHGLKGDFGGGGKSNEIAKVNGRAIDQLRYREILNRVAQGVGANVGPQEMAFVENLALGQAIDFTLLLNEAQKKVRVSGSEIDSAIDGIMRQQNVPSKRELELALKKMGLDMGKFRDLIRDDIAVQKLNTKLREEVKVSPDDLREIQASHILLSDEATAKLVLGKIRSGADFAALAKQYSRDPGSAAKGGALGYFATGSMVPAFEKAAFALKVGEISGIVQTPFGYHLIKVTDSRLRKFP